MHLVPETRWVPCRLVRTWLEGTREEGPRKARPTSPLPQRVMPSPAPALFVLRCTSSGEQALCKVESFVHVGQLCSCVVEIVTQRVDDRPNSASPAPISNSIFRA